MIGIVAVVLWGVQDNKRKAEQRAVEYKALVESGVVFPTQSPGGATVWQHGACSINHRSERTAEQCAAKRR